MSGIDSYVKHCVGERGVSVPMPDSKQVMKLIAMRAGSYFGRIFGRRPCCPVVL